MASSSHVWGLASTWSRISIGWERFFVFVSPLFRFRGFRRYVSCAESALLLIGAELFLDSTKCVSDSASGNLSMKFLALKWQKGLSANQCATPSFPPPALRPPTAPSSIRRRRCIITRITTDVKDGLLIHGTASCARHIKPFIRAACWLIGCVGETPPPLFWRSPNNTERERERERRVRSMV